MLIMCLTANDGPKLIVSVNRVRVVKHCLAAFDLIFLLNPSFESTCAQNKSCRPSIPLQLLFWPNFGFQYEIWSFWQSNFDQNHLKRVQLGTVLPRLVSAADLDVRVATRHTGKHLTA